MSHDSGAVRERSRLSTPQTLHLMRLEVENAVKHGYPISCVMFGLDGFFASDLMLHRRVLMPLIFRELKRLTFERELRGLGIWTEGFQLAVFPHTSPDDVRELADELRERAHGVVHRSVPEDEAIAVSIGLSHNLHSGEVTFESLVSEAESGMSMSFSAGGDRVTMWREVESEVDRLRDELEEQLAEIAEVQERVFGKGTTQEQAWGRALIERVIGVFHDDSDPTDEILRLETMIVSLLKEELAQFTTSSSATQLLDAQEQIENLERRVRKLTNSLGRTEEELHRIASMKDVEMGVASLYRTVQGLSAGDEHAGAKKEMLKNIFEANLALRAEMTSGA